MPGLCEKCENKYCLNNGNEKGFDNCNNFSGNKEKDKAKELQAETILAIFDWIEKHSVIKDKDGNILHDAYIDIGDKTLLDYWHERFNKE